MKLLNKDTIDSYFSALHLFVTLFRGEKKS